MSIVFLWVILLVSLSTVYCENKYSREANVKLSDHFEEDPNIKIRNVDKPFRMAKLNLIWSKAKLVSTKR